MMREINDAGLAIIKKAEGLFLTAYLCPSKIWTIGYGHTKGVQEGDTCTEDQALEWLADDLVEAEEDVAREVGVGLNDNQFSALVSFTFNVGGGDLATSTLLRDLNNGSYDAVPGQLALWIHDHTGAVDGGLVTRRAAEAALWKTPT